MEVIMLQSVSQIEGSYGVRRRYKVADDLGQSWVDLGWAENITPEYVSVKYLTDNQAGVLFTDKTPVEVAKAVIRQGGLYKWATKKKPDWVAAFEDEVEAERKQPSGPPAPTPFTPISAE